MKHIIALFALFIGTLFLFGCRKEDTRTDFEKVYDYFKKAGTLAENDDKEGYIIAKNLEDGKYVSFTVYEDKTISLTHTSGDFFILITFSFSNNVEYARIVFTYKENSYAIDEEAIILSNKVIVEFDSHNFTSIDGVKVLAEIHTNETLDAFSYYLSGLRVKIR